ncbi:MAG: hypothetical protein HOI65_01315 [Opitutae bacterium]|nr:hypothetical protein [Opitutae bacterium]
MISFINRILEKGGSWIMSILLAVIVVAFVFTIGAAPGLTQKEKGLGETDYYGVDFSPNSKERRDLAERAEIQATMQMGQFLNNPQFSRFVPQLIGQQTQRNALENLPLSQLAEKLSVPEASLDEMHKFIKEQSLFQDTPAGLPQGQPGKYSQEKFDDFLDRLKANDSELQFQEAIKEAILVGKLQDILNGPGTALPFEAVAKVRSDKTQWAMELITLERKKGSTQPANPDEEELKALYIETKSEYATEEKRKVSYLVFEAEYSHPSNEQLSEYYKKHSARFIPVEEKSEKDQIDPKKPEEEQNKKEAIPAYKSLAYEIKQDILDDFIRDRGLKKIGLKVAGTKAEELLDKIYNDAKFLNKIQTEEIITKQGILQFSHLEPYGIAAFPKKQFIKDINAPFFDHSPSDQENKQVEKLLKQAFSLSEDRFYTEPQLIGDKYIILILEKVHESKSPEFEKLKKDAGQYKKLVSVWQEQTEEKELSEMREKAENDIKTSLSEGKSFENSAKMKLTEEWSLSYSKYVDFTSNKLPEGLPVKIFDAAKILAKGESSAMEVIDGKGYMVSYFEKKVPNYNSNHNDVGSELERLQSSSRSSLTQEMVTRGQAAMKVNIFEQTAN